MAEDGRVPSLAELCLQAAVQSEFWRVQRRQLACLPDIVANELLRRLLQQRCVAPPQLELFTHCVTTVELAGSSITGPWLAYLGGFPSLRALSLQRCTKLRDRHLQHLAALAPSLQELDLAGCSGMGNGTAAALIQLRLLRRLNLSGTSLGPESIHSLCSALTELTNLSLVDLPVDDACCEAMGAHLPSLASLNLAGTAVGDTGAAHLERLCSLTALDLSYTQVHCPPVAPSLHELAMNSCSLGMAEDSTQAALWLHVGTCLPHLQDLQLASTSLLPLHGKQLLRAMLVGAAGSLRRLNLRDGALGDALESLAGATQLTWLDLSGTPVTDGQLEHLALAPLRWASFARTAVTDDIATGGMKHMNTLTCLDLSATRVGDGCWAALAQLPQLEWLDLSDTRLTVGTLHEGGHEFAALTYLNLNSSQLENRGCRQLAASLPQLRELWLGSKAVDDKGLRALCRLPRLERLQLFHCAVSDPGLLSALPRCPALCRLELNHCWLASGAGLQAAAAAYVQAAGRLAEVLLDGTPVELPSSGAAAAAGTPHRKRPGPGVSNVISMGLAGDGAQASRQAPQSAPRGGAVLPAHVLAHDERLVYSREELLSLALGHAAGRCTSGMAERQLRQQLPPDLRSSPT